jgi:hypothetical protein
VALQLANDHQITYRAPFRPQSGADLSLFSLRGFCICKFTELCPLTHPQIDASLSATKEAYPTSYHVPPQARGLA